jgi:hypothetical protein
MKGGKGLALSPQIFMSIETQKKTQKKHTYVIDMININNVNVKLMLVQCYKKHHFGGNQHLK